MANHGYLPRNGTHISFSMLTSALQRAYGITYPLAFVLTIGGYIALQQWGEIGLDDIGRHNRVEHDASLVHRDTKEGTEYAPIEIDHRLVDELCESVDKVAGEIWIMDAADVGKARVRREAAARPLDSLHSEVARGEMALVLGIFKTVCPLSGKTGVPVEWLREWIGSERLPEGGNWKPARHLGLFETVGLSKEIRKASDAFRAKGEIPIERFVEPSSLPGGALTSEAIARALANEDVDEQPASADSTTLKHRRGFSESSFTSEEDSLLASTPGTSRFLNRSSTPLTEPDLEHEGDKKD